MKKELTQREFASLGGKSHSKKHMSELGKKGMKSRWNKAKNNDKTSLSTNDDK